MKKRKSANQFVIVKNFIEILFGIAASVVGALLLSYPVFYGFAKFGKLGDIVGLNLNKLMSNYFQLMNYLLLPFQSKLSMSNFKTSVTGAHHFYEVKNLFQIALAVFIVILIFKIWARLQGNVFVMEKHTALIVMIIPVVVLPFAFINFDTFFATFHQILFNNSDWLFDPTTDPIINVLPEDFFATMFAIFLLLYELYFGRFLLNKKSR